MAVEGEASKHAVAVDDVGGPSAEDVREASPKLIFLICLISAIEGADMILLPSVFAALQLDLHLSLSDLAQMSLFQAVFQSAAAPVWGVLADRGILQRKTILVVGAVLQGLVTCILAGVDSLAIIVALRSLNGALLATLRPVSSGMLADVTAEARRGKVFGWPSMAVNIGMVFGGLIGTPLSTQSIAGMQGWRVAFLGIGGASILVGLAVALLMTEPERDRSTDAQKQDVTAEVKRLAAFFRMPTFTALVVQGIFGCVAGYSMGYRTLFFQVAGITDFQASVLQSAGLLACACGSVIGGVLSDWLVKHYLPLHGRPFLAQIAVFLGLPNFCLTFLVHPSEELAFWFYLSLSVAGGLTTWCLTAVNLPILSEIVPASHRSAVMAWQTSIEGAAAAVLGNAMVGLLAENVYGYDLSNTDREHIKSEQNREALGHALVFTSCVPLSICLCFYSLLHWSYPRDLRLAREAALASSAAPRVK